MLLAAILGRVADVQNNAVGARRRQQIIESALMYFSEKGYHDTSLSMIARDIGITTAGVVYHFPTKQHLLVAMADYRLDLFEQWGKAIRNDEDPFWFWRTTVMMTEKMASRPGVIELFTTFAFAAADPKSPIHEIYTERNEQVVAMETQFFQEGIDKGIFRPDIDCEALARFDIAVSDGLQLQWAVSNGAFDIVEAVRTRNRLIVNSIIMPGIVVDF